MYTIRSNTNLQFGTKMVKANQEIAVQVVCLRISETLQVHQRSIVAWQADSSQSV